MTADSAARVSTEGGDHKRRAKRLCSLRDTPAAACSLASWGRGCPGAPCGGLQAFDILQPSLAGAGLPFSQSRGVLLCALFHWLWVGFVLLLVLLALHEKYSIKFCILLQGPVEPNLKSVERVWSCPVRSLHIGYFFEGTSCGPNEYWKTHCKMQASELESC